MQKIKKWITNFKIVWLLSVDGAKLIAHGIQCIGFVLECVQKHVLANCILWDICPWNKNYIVVLPMAFATLYLKSPNVYGQPF